MTPEIAAFAAEQRNVRTVWGVSDCTLMVADYVAAITGRDPAAPWRGVYSTREGAQCEIAAAGGLAGFGRSLPWPRVSEVRAGDVAVVAPRRLPFIPKALAAPRFAICAGDTWMIKAGDFGVVFIKREAWRVVDAWGPR